METYKINLDSNLTKDYESFRSATSGIFTHRGNDYPVVNHSKKDFSLLTIMYDGKEKITLAVNLQDYYVYGFLFNNKCYAFKGTEKEELIAAGIKVPIEEIPFGDAYFEIGAGGIEKKVEAEVVSSEVILSSIDFIVNINNSWDDKREHILRVFWALVEGIRFCGISNVVQTLFNSTEKVNTTYAYFFYMAERWEKTSIGNAYLGKMDKSIAVYDLRPMEPKKK